MPLTDRETREKNGLYRCLENQEMVYFICLLGLPMLFCGSLDYVHSEDFKNAMSSCAFIHSIAVFIVGSLTNSRWVMPIPLLLIFILSSGALVDYDNMTELSEYRAKQCIERIICSFTVLLVFGIYLSVRMAIIDSRQDKIEDEEIKRRRDNNSKRI